MLGKILWFNHEKQVGVIEADDGARVDVQRAGFAGGAAPDCRCAGLGVSFDLIGGRDRREAVNVVLAVAPEYGRARLRHGSRVRT